MTTTSSSAANWDHTVDVLVIGSGAAGMVTALTAHDRGAATMLIEKASEYGGSSSRSGGGLWIPNNHLMKQAGIQDTPEKALTYLKAVVGSAEPVERLEAFVKSAPEMLRYLSDHTRLKPQVMPRYPDYYPDKPGWCSGGRSVESETFDAKPLGDEILNMHIFALSSGIMGRYHVTINQGHDMLVKKPGWMMTFMKIIAKYWLDIPWRFKSKRSRDTAFGQGLVASLRLSLMDRKIPLWLSTPARELIQENGRVVGVVAERDGKTVRIRANKGVVMAAGGFESNQALREKYLPKPTHTSWTAASPNNTGDALALGLSVGAKIDYMATCCWMPVMLIPAVGAQSLLSERTAPGSIIVNQGGKRFMNEAAPYIGAVNAIYANNRPEGSSVPSYMIFDASYRWKYILGQLMPGMVQPDFTVPQGIMQKANSLDELAQVLGIDASGLKDTVSKVNQFAQTGVDSDYHRGENDYDRFFGDPAVKPNTCLGFIKRPPFYGVKVYPGDLGTTGGLKTDVHARVLTEQGEVIPGFYAVGNCSASAIAGTYPGAGCTLGPATTFGYIAARHLTQEDSK